MTGLEKEEEASDMDEGRRVDMHPLLHKESIAESNHSVIPTQHIYYGMNSRENPYHDCRLCTCAGCQNAVLVVFASNLLLSPLNEFLRFVDLRALCFSTDGQ